MFGNFTTIDIMLICFNCSILFLVFSVLAGMAAFTISKAWYKGKLEASRDFFNNLKDETFKMKGGRND